MAKLSPPIFTLLGNSFPSPLITFGETLSTQEGFRNYLHEILLRINIKCGTLAKNQDGATAEGTILHLIDIYF